jgi:hypothetical protein
MWRRKMSKVPLFMGIIGTILIIIGVFNASTSSNREAIEETKFLEFYIARDLKATNGVLIVPENTPLEKIEKVRKAFRPSSIKFVPYPEKEQ